MDARIEGYRLAEPALQRAEGSLRLAWSDHGGVTRLAELAQSGCLRACFPRSDPSGFTGAVAVNISGGVASGDRLSITATVAPDARATLTTQAAERIYRAIDLALPARLSTSIAVGTRGCAEYLPQETILFDGGSFERQLSVELAAEARFVGVEWLLFGRRARGERIRRARVRDRIRIFRAGKLIWQDLTRLDGDVAAQLARPAIGNGAAAMASLIFAGPDAEQRLAPLRAALAPFDAGASCWNGLLIARILADDGALLRRAVTQGLAALRDDRTLPRVWLC